MNRETAIKKLNEFIGGTVQIHDWAVMSNNELILETQEGTFSIIRVGSQPHGVLARRVDPWTDGGFVNEEEYVIEAQYIHKFSITLLDDKAYSLFPKGNLDIGIRSTKTDYEYIHLNDTFNAILAYHHKTRHLNMPELNELNNLALIFSYIENNKTKEA